MIRSSLLSRVTEAMERIAPLSLADTKWDNVGVLLQSHENALVTEKSIVEMVLLTIDYTNEVFEECVKLKERASCMHFCNQFSSNTQKNSNMLTSCTECSNIMEESNVNEVEMVIVAYHPIIFAPLKSLTMNDPKSKLLVNSIKANFSIFCPHTSLDASIGGMNDWLVSIIDEKAINIKPIVSFSEQEKKYVSTQEANNTLSLVQQVCQSECPGYGRAFELSKPSILRELVTILKEKLKINDVHVATPHSYTIDNYVVRSVAVCAGSGGSMFKPLINANYSNNNNNSNCASSGEENEHIDCFVTGEMSHHEVLSAVASGAAVILTRHTNSERGFLSARLQPQLEHLLNDSMHQVHVVVSVSDKDPLTTY